MKKKNIFAGYKIVRITAIAAFIVVAGIISLKAHSHSSSNVPDETVEIELSDHDKMTEVSDASRDPLQNTFKYYVYICGEVNTPGVYECEPQTRLGALVDMAGGATPDADLTSVNLAREVSDGEQIIILKKGSDDIPAAGQPQNNAAPSGVSPNSNFVNINTADETTLKTLPGIGDAKAKAIVDYRTQNGSFKKIEDIMNISGIKNAAFDKIKDLITV